MVRKSWKMAGFAALVGGAVLSGCDGSGGENPDANGSKAKAKAKAEAEAKAPDPVMEKLEGGPFPTLLVTQAWFWTDPAGRPKPGPARLELWRETPDGWRPTRMEDADSNVFHKAIPYDGGILTIGAEGAILKKWTPQEDGSFSQEKLWEQSWGGKFNRLRDLEIGDVDGDGKDEFIIATHDAGVVAVIESDSGTATELDQKADTFVHEIEIGDIDGDGKAEFFATPTGRNTAGKSQPGDVVMYRWDGSQYARTVVEAFAESHAKEILTVDIDGDGKDELFSVIEAELAGKTIIRPVEVRQHTLQEDGTFTSEVVFTIQDRQTRFLVPGDFDGDGTQELVAATISTGLLLFDLKAPAEPPKKGEEPAKPVWERSLIDQVSSGYEHATYAADLDGDGVLELYVAADDQRELKKYVWDKEKGEFKKVLLGRLPDKVFTWNITTGTF